MTSFLTRVEFHGATYTDYENLHRAMRVEGFSLTIRGDDGQVYHLPSAEYDISTSASGEAVRAAASTGRKYAVVVVRYDAAWWTGLSAANAA